jgi:hypothetical protein
MIYRLYRFQYHSFKGIGIFYAAAVTLLFCTTLFAGHVGISITIMAFLFLLGTRAVARNTMLETLLPIPARDIFCARLLANLLSIWPLFFAVIAAIPFSHVEAKRQTTVVVVEALLLITLGMIAIYSVRARDLQAPKWWKQTIGWTGMIAVSALFIQTDFDPVPMVLTVLAIAICALACVALFWKTWKSTPESFQLAPPEPVFQKSQEGKFRFQSHPWMPVLRALFPKETRSVSILLMFFGLMGMSVGGIFFIWISIMIAISRIVRNDQWLLSLPISRQKLFLAIVFIPLVLFSLGGIFHPVYSHQTPREEIVDWLAVATMSLLGVLVFEIQYLARRRIRVVYRLLLYLAASFTFIYLVLHWFLRGRGPDGSKTLPIDVWLANILPAQLPSLILTVLAAVGMLYWIAYAGFRHAEVQRYTRTQRAQ